MQACLRSTISMITALVLGFANPAAADDALKDISKRVSDLRSTFTTAEVYLVERDLAFIRDLTEHDVTRTGCRHAYVATNRLDLDNLVSVLAGAGLTEIRGTGEEPDVRIVVYLYGNNRQRDALVLTRDHSNARASGEYRHEDPRQPNYRVTVEAVHGIEADLRIWAAQNPALLGNCRH